MRRGHLASGLGDEMMDEVIFYLSQSFEGVIWRSGGQNTACARLTPRCLNPPKGFVRVRAQLLWQPCSPNSSRLNPRRGRLAFERGLPARTDARHCVSIPRMGHASLLWGILGKISSQSPEGPCLILSSFPIAVKRNRAHALRRFVAHADIV